MAGEDANKWAKRSSRRPPERRRLSFAIGLLIGCLLASITYYTVFRVELDFVFLSFLRNSSPPSSSPALPASTTNSLPRLAEGEEDDSMAKERAAAARNVGRSSDSTATTVNKTAVADAERPPTKPMCDSSSFRTDVCDIEGDIRVLGKHSSSVILVSPSGGDTTMGKGSWKVKPYARKWDGTAMANVREVHVRGGAPHEAPPCAVTHAVPGVVFSSTGYCGNIFHDFSDVLLPLFQTARRFDGQVQFLVANNQSWWLHKYRHFLSKLSSHAPIGLDGDDRVHCFKRLIVGMRADGDLMIDATANGGVSIMDYAGFLREAYSLPRERPWAGGERRPRLLFIARKRTRRFVNLGELVAMAEAVGFEVVSAEPDFMDMAGFARTINSCDVMVGVHGAGMTNFMFLPTGAVVVQVLPLAKLESIARTYGEPAKKIGLRYLQYDINEEESTLIELYPRDHRVFRDPDSVHREGWNKMGEVYLQQQSVRLDLKRFRPVLEKALRLLKHKTEHATMAEQ